MSNYLFPIFQFFQISPILVWYLGQAGSNSTPILGAVQQDQFLGLYLTKKQCRYQILLSQFYCFFFESENLFWLNQQISGVFFKMVGIFPDMLSNRGQVCHRSFPHFLVFFNPDSGNLIFPPSWRERWVKPHPRVPNYPNCEACPNGVLFRTPPYENILKILNMCYTTLLSFWC